MGGAASYNQAYVSDNEGNQVQWKLLPSTEEARKKFEADGSLNKNSDPEHLELRALLDEPIAQRALGKYAKERKALDIFMCWIDVQEYKSIPTEDYRRSKALHLYHKYIKENAVLEVGGITDSDKAKYKELIDKSKTNKDVLTNDFFDAIQYKCFTEMYHNIFLPFKGTSEFEVLSKKIREKYNNVKIEDFEYFKKLGEGGFGLVIHCMKKSTGKHYAMKIQTKKGLLECFSDDPWRADYEKQAFAACQHPFIVNMDYAFQNNTLAIMVLGLATAGDLQKALLNSPDEKLSEDRVQFYTAEIVLALAHLHQMGLMYRDLKPNNVLLNANGHIQLVDLGGVVDERGTLLGVSEADKGLIPLFMQKFKVEAAQQEEDNSASEPSSNKPAKRRLSIMGTFGYMAPEMVIMLSQSSGEKVGYSNAVDWWSLGVTIFKLLTGYRPFTEENFNAFVEMATTLDGQFSFNDAPPEYAMLFQEIPFPEYISGPARDFISKLLDVNEKSRLGSGPTGINDIKTHHFFKGIDWDLLGQKHVEPPFKPEVKSLDESSVYPSFEAMLKDLGKENWLTDEPTEHDQKYFANWDFTSTHTLRVEFGLSNEMEQYDRNFKVRQLMGSKDDKSGNSARTSKRRSII